MAKILIIGCGDIGAALAENLVQGGHEVTGLKRTIPTQPSLINYIKADVTKPSELINVPLDFNQVIYILSPSKGEISAYEEVFKVGVDNVLDRFKSKGESTAFTFVSSTRVYGQQKGEWLNEGSETKPTDERGKLLLAAENKFLLFNRQTTIVRFSGIYGRSNYFLNQLKKGVEIQKKPPYYTNRIHRADCIGVLAYITESKEQGKPMMGVFVASDNDPASKWDVACFLADAFDVNQPNALKLDKGADCNKRLENKRLLEEGYKFKYATYKEGYREAFDE